MGAAACQFADARCHPRVDGEDEFATRKQVPHCGNVSVQCGDKAYLISSHKWDSSALADWKLIQASSTGDLHSLREALQQGANVDSTRAMRLSTCKRRQHRQECKPHGSDVGEIFFERSGRVRSLTPLMRAAEEGHDRAVAMLLTAGASWHVQDEDGMQALHFAAACGSLGCCAVLLAAGADSTALDDFGRDPFSCLPRECTAFPTERKRWEFFFRRDRYSCGEDTEEARFHSGAFHQRASAPKARASESVTLK